jgi:diaminopimelate decarboxylase
MFVSDCLNVNENGNLTIGGCDTLALAKQFGTPLYVMDESTIRNNCRLYKDSIDNFYGGKGLVLYASKAFSCKEIYRIVNSENLGIDVVSGGELYTALQAGFPAHKIYFHGNNKTAAELSFALDAGVGFFVVDNLTELELLNSISAQKSITASILFRIKPGIDVHTHDFIKTGQIDSKFGVALETGEAEQAVKAALKCSNIKLVGINCHIGSQIFEIEPFELAAEVMLGFVADMKIKYGIEFEQLNLGGGFGIKYIPSQDPVEYDKYMEKVSVTVKEVCEKKGLKMPYILIEPGRSIVASSGITLYTVGSVKEIPNIRTYVSVDGGMCDNPRYSLYKSPYDAIIANKATEKRVKTVTIAGRCCESDLLQENITIQNPEPGDIIAFFATGAYNYSMAMTYNRLPRPAVVMITNGQPHVIVKRETYEHLTLNDI